ncbi:MAG: protein kinase domain-containing protein [Gemmatimonadaceae bacterium]
MSGVLPATDLQARLQRAVGDAYALERELGGGGMSRLFLATEASLNRKVVIKLLAPELTGDVSLARFKREFELTALLQHPNILPVLATGSRDGMLWYVTPYIAGESLRHRLQRETRLPIDDVARVLHEVSDALAYAHERGVVHRDIKPENILLSNGHAVLADFGIAAALAPGATPQPEAPDGARLTQVGTAMGTPGYMSPEQAAGEWNLDSRADIYALGCVGYEMLGGRPPFVGPSPRHVIAAHLSEPPRPVEELRPDAPPGIVEAVMRSLAKEPGDRWQTAAEFRDALGMSFTGSRASYARAAPRRRRRGLLAAFALAAVALVAAGAWLFSRDGAGGLDENLVAVAPFEVLDPALTVWREGLVDVLSANLDGMGPLRTVPPTTAIRRWSGRPDRETATALGQKTGAKLVLFGRVVRAGGDSARVSATLFDVGAGRALAELEASDASSRVDRIADSLTVRVLRELNQTRAIGSVRRASLGSSSIAAIKAYLQGEQHFRRSDFDSAAAYYERAIAADSTFAPALRKLAQSYAWNITGSGGENAGRAYPLSLRAGQLNRGLAPRESLLVVADSINAAVMTNAGRIRRPLAARLLALLDSAVRRFPDDPEIWYRLGDARYHMLAMGQAPETYHRAREAFDRSISLDSAFGPSYIHPVDIALREQDVEGARRYMASYLALKPHDTYARSFRLLQELTDAEAARGVPPDSVWSGGPSVISNVISGMQWVFDENETILRLLRNAGDAGGDPRLAQQAKNGLAYMLAMRGHVREAVQLTSDSTLWYMRPDLALVGAFPSDSMDRKGREFLRGDSLTQIASSYVFRTWADRGDTVPLLEALRLSERWPITASGARYWPVVARGYLALARRDTAAALNELMVVPDTFCVGYPACHITRYTKAQLLLAKGRNAEAAKTLDIDFQYTGPLGVLWQLAKGQAHERLGDREKAIDAYTFVANAFRKADPPLQPVAEEARKGLRRLAADRAASGG